MPGQTIHGGTVTMYPVWAVLPRCCSDGTLLTVPHYSLSSHRTHAQRGRVTLRSERYFRVIPTHPHYGTLNRDQNRKYFAQYPSKKIFVIMFATPSSYSVTPAKSNFARIPERASSIIRDVKRRSLRTCRSKTLPEKRLSGMSASQSEPCMK